VAVTISAIVVLAAPFVMSLMGVGLLNAFGYLGFVATFGFLFAYILVSIAAPMYLRRIGEPKPAAVVMSVLSVAMLAVATVGSVVLSPTTPYNYLPYVFLGLLAVGVLRFVWVRMKRPALVADIAADLIGDVAAG